MNNEKVKNSFCSPESRSEGLDFSDDIISTYELVDAFISGPTKQDTDFVTFKKPKLVESWHQNKRVREEAKGMDLKSIIKRFQKSGDPSLLSPRDAVYGDETLVPKSRSDMLQRAKDTERYLDSLSASEKEKLIKLSKMSKSEYQSYLVSEYDRIMQQTKQKQEGEENK